MQITLDREKWGSLFAAVGGIEHSIEGRYDKITLSIEEASHIDIVTISGKHKNRGKHNIGEEVQNNTMVVER